MVAALHLHMLLCFQGDTATQSSKEIDLMLSVNVKGECWVEFDVLHTKLSCSLVGACAGGVVAVC